MKATTKEMLRRALRTFVQAAISYISVNLVYVVSGAENDLNLIKDGLFCLQISATAAGLAAVMNLPQFQKTEPVPAEPETETTTSEDEANVESENIVEEEVEDEEDMR